MTRSEHPDTYITPKTIERLRRNIPEDFEESQDPSDLELICKNATEIAKQEFFFHWELEFPTVFDGENPGFDCVLGNPPWEEVKNSSEEFFASSAPRISNAPKNRRKKLISDLKGENPELYQKWRREENRVEKRRRFYSNSPTVKKGSIGKTNTYPLFTYHNLQITSTIGKTGFIIKTAIATAHDYSKLFKELASEGYVDSLYDFENKQDYFPDVSRERFCLLTLRGNSVKTEPIELVFSLNTVNDLNETEIPKLTLEELKNLSSGSYQLPVLNSTTDLRLVTEVANKDIVAPLEKKESGWGTFWGFPYDAGEVQSDAIVREDLINSEDYEHLGIYEKYEGEQYAALYEGKFIDFYDHRSGSFEGVEESSRFGQTPALYQFSQEEKNDPSYEIEPRYWVKDKHVEEYYTNRGWTHDWLFAYGRKGRTTDTRTYKSAIIPTVGVADTAPVVLPVDADSKKEAALQSLALCGITNSFVFDYLVRSNITGSTIGKNLLNRMFVPKYDKISEELETLASKVLKLIHTTHTLDPIADALDDNSGPYNWNEDTRQKLRWQIDGLVANLYNLSEDEIEHILCKFDIKRSRELEKFGEYRTMKNVLNYMTKYNNKLGYQWMDRNE
jgi:hypothetical protein